MKRPWQVWTLFGVCLAIVFPAVAWLTVRTLQLERTREAARAEAELERRQRERQERIAVALWRMDWMITPLIAQEIARPSYAYQPFLANPLAGGGKGQQPRVLSPLLSSQSPYVLLYFEVSADNVWSSPQNPAGKDAALAEDLGVPAERIATISRRLATLRDRISYERLLAKLPDTLLPAVPLPGREPSEPIASLAPETNRSGSGPAAGPQSADQPVPELPPYATNVQPEQQRAVGAPGPQQLVQRDQFEFSRRNEGVQNFAQTQRSQLMSNSLLPPQAEWAREGVSRPLWIDSSLILARRVVADNTVRIQGCWLDWPRISRLLLDEVADLFPRATLVPVTADGDVPASRLLASLPVRLELPEITAVASADGRTPAGETWFSAIELSLLFAWLALLLAALAAAVLLRSMMVLSERRAAFVSAVTHELRNPLTTFRMYAEMLSQGMVRDESRRHQYLETLRVEADRLSHLVENVLQYARLERGKRECQRKSIELGELHEQCTPRLADRARQAGMELHVTLNAEGKHVRLSTDPTAVEQILFNLVDNACKYASAAEDRRIHVNWSAHARVVKIRVSDHGPGIGRVQRKKLFRPFSKSDREAAHSAPGVGLGLALCHRLARQLDGRLIHDPGEGAAFVLEIPASAGSRRESAAT